METEAPTLSKMKVENLEANVGAILVGSFSRKMKPSATGEYAMVRLTDNTGSVFARVWNDLPIFKTVMELEDGDSVQADVTCTDTGEYTHVKINSIEVVEIPRETIVDIEALKKELRKYLRGMKDKGLRAVILAVFARPEINEAFFKAPASQTSGYSFEGGLLAHAVRLIRLTRAVAKVFQEWVFNKDGFVSKLNEDLLVAASILHDVGFVHMFKQSNIKIEKTDEGKLFDGGYLTMKIILEELEKSSLPQEQKMMLEHVLGSSRGKQNYGALFIPRSREAVAFHLVESLDMKMANFEYMERTAGAEQSFVQLFQKQYFLGSFDE